MNNQRIRSSKKILCIIVVFSLTLIFITSCSNSQQSNNVYNESKSEFYQENNVNNIISEDENSNYDPVGKLLSETLMYPSQNDEWKYDVYQTYIEITEYVGDTSKTNIVVPEKIENLPVKAFSASIRGGVNSIDLPSTLIILGERNGYSSFGSSLKSINLPEGLIEIGEDVFSGCEELSDIQLPSTLRRIGESAFEYCDSLTSLTIPASMEKIEAGAFWSCDALEEVTILSTTVSLDVSNLKCTTIFGYAGSTAASYASNRGINFKIIEE